MENGEIDFFLGSGASAQAGIPTGGTMIWDFNKSTFSISLKAPACNVQSCGIDAQSVRTRCTIFAVQVSNSTGSGVHPQRHIHMTAFHSRE